MLFFWVGKNDVSMTRKHDSTKANAHTRRKIKVDVWEIDSKIDNVFSVGWTWVYNLFQSMFPNIQVINSPPPKIKWARKD